MNYGVHFGEGPIEMSDCDQPNAKEMAHMLSRSISMAVEIRNKNTEIARLREALTEIASQCHNLPRSKTVDRIDTLARAALAAQEKT